MRDLDEDREFAEWAAQEEADTLRRIAAFRERIRGPELGPAELETYQCRVALAMLDEDADYINATLGEAPFAPQVVEAILRGWVRGLQLQAALAGSDLVTQIHRRLAELSGGTT